MPMALIGSFLCSHDLSFFWNGKLHIKHTNIIWGFLLFIWGQAFFFFLLVFFFFFFFCPFFLFAISFIFFCFGLGTWEWESGKLDYFTSTLFKNYYCHTITILYTFFFIFTFTRSYAFVVISIPPLAYLHQTSSTLFRLLSFCFFSFLFSFPFARASQWWCVCVK